MSSRTSEVRIVNCRNLLAIKKHLQEGTQLFNPEQGAASKPNVAKTLQLPRLLRKT